MSQSDRSLSRRSLLGVLAASTSGVAMGATLPSVMGLLRASDGRERIGGILKKNLSLKEIQSSFVAAFYQSLLAGVAHRGNQTFFLEHLDDAALNERLEIYVIEEFFVSTNYMSLLSGQAHELKLT